MDFLKAEIERKKRQMQDSKLVGPGNHWPPCFTAVPGTDFCFIFMSSFQIFLRFGRLLVLSLLHKAIIEPRNEKFSLEIDELSLFMRYSSLHLYTLGFIKLGFISYVFIQWSTYIVGSQGVLF